MPPVLVKAHADLDRAVERCYRKDPFPTDRSRVEFLFALYENLTAPLVLAEKPKTERWGSWGCSRRQEGQGDKKTLE